MADASNELMTAVRTEAGRRVHRLAPDQTGGRPLSERAALGVLNYLETRCPLRDNEGPAVPAGAPVHEAQRARSMAYYRCIPPGRYAVESLSGSNDLDFFEIRRPEEGQFRDYTFVDQIVGGKENFKVKGPRAQRALEAILAAGIDEARLLAAQELRQCMYCGSHLTKEESRQRGAGQDCWENNH